MVVLVVGALVGAGLTLLVGVSSGQQGWVVVSVLLSAVALLGALLSMRRPRRVRMPVTPASRPVSGDESVPVVVVDGRPRYHLAECAVLTAQRDDGEESVEIPLGQAVEDGFRPCQICQPPT
jgi:hypothetical protein